MSTDANSEGFENLNHLLFGIKTSDMIESLARQHCTCFRSRLQPIEIAPANHDPDCNFRKMLENEALRNEAS